MPYSEDKPIPPGYRLEERTRTGLVVAGSIVLGVPYVIGLSAASGAHGQSAMNWLFVPALGPWMALGARHSSCQDVATREGSLCGLGDAFTTMGLIFDGILQTTGATLLIVGLAVPKKVLLRQDVVRLTVLHVGSGTGVGLRGTF